MVKLKGNGMTTGSIWIGIVEKRVLRMAAWFGIVLKLRDSFFSLYLRYYREDSSVQQYKNGKVSKLRLWFEVLLKNT